MKAGPAIAWDRVKAWDERYTLRIFDTAEEYAHQAVASTDGDRLTLADGRELVDFTSGLLCVNLGQRDQRIRDAVVEALGRYQFVHEMYATDYRAQASKLIIEDLLGGEAGWASRVRFTSSGSEAVELALLLAKLVTGRPNVVSRQYGYHGWTQGAVSCMGLGGQRGLMVGPEAGSTPVRPAGVPQAGTYFAPAPHCHRCPISHVYPDCKGGGSSLACIHATHELLRTIGPDSVAAVIVEPIASVAIFIPPAEYLGQLRELCDRYGILLILDEIMTGFGRTGRWFAHERFDTTPDLMTIGKGVVSGALPAGGVVLGHDLAREMSRHRWESISTFSGHPVVMAAVSANIEAMLDEDIPTQADVTGQMFGKRLREVASRHPCVDAVDGVGMFWAIELDGGSIQVAEDRQFVPDGEITSPSTIVGEAANAAGLAIVTGGAPNSLRLAPSLTLKRDTMDQGFAALDKGLEALDRAR